MGKIKNDAIDVLNKLIEMIEDNELTHTPRAFISELRDWAKDSLKKIGSKPTKFLLIEDGSVDTDTLEDQLENRPDILMITYRQGSRKPELVILEEHHE